jgi:hypothetical protein
LADRLAALSAKECETVFEALQLIHPLFQPAGEKIAYGGTKI